MWLLLAAAASLGAAAPVVIAYTCADGGASCADEFAACAAFPYPQGMDLTAPRCACWADLYRCYADCSNKFPGDFYARCSAACPPRVASDGGVGAVCKPPLNANVGLPPGSGARAAAPAAAALALAAAAALAGAAARAP
jgi:hypothetical protein